MSRSPEPQLTILRLLRRRIGYAPGGNIFNLAAHWLRTAASPPKHIVVVGYPKSGNTWATRLVAEMIGCPVAGFGLPGSIRPDIGEEGHSRISDFIVTKSHAQYNAIAAAKGVSGIVCIVRDPRDIAISGTHYFKPAASDSRPGNQADAFEPMVLAICDGGPFYGCEVPWGHCVSAFLDHGIPIFRYEDMLANSETEAKRMLAVLGIERTDAEIAAAVARQSFAVRKHQFIAAKQAEHVKFMRSGTQGQGADLLNASQIQRIERAAGPVMQQLGYPLRGAL